MAFSTSTHLKESYDWKESIKRNGVPFLFLGAFGGIIGMLCKSYAESSKFNAIKEELESDAIVESSEQVTVVEFSSQ